MTRRSWSGKAAHWKHQQFVDSVDARMRYYEKTPRKADLYADLAEAASNTARLLKDDDTGALGVVPK